MLAYPALGFNSRIRRELFRTPPARIIAPMNAKILQDDLIHTSHIFRVHRLELCTPRGQQIQRDMVRTLGAALVLPVCDDGSIVMIRNYRFAHDAYLWELPCGGLDPDDTAAEWTPGESPEQCALRELKEEAGYTAGRIEPLGEVLTTPGFTTEIIYHFLATELKAGEQALEDTEDITVHVVPDADVRAMVRRGDITDAKTLTALMMYWMRDTNDQPLAGRKTG